MKTLNSKFDTHISSDGNEYKIAPSHTYYNIETSDEMIEILEGIRANGTRCRFHWGNVVTGEDWGDEYDVKGKIGRSTGECKIPLLIHNQRSYGGGAILTHCIVKITETRSKRVIYQHPTYFIKPENDTDYFRKSC